jgi:transposase-like protein
MATERFKAWAKLYGIKKLAKDVGVHQSTVYAWLDETIVPHDAHRLKILALAGRKLRLGDVVSGF